MPRSRFPWSLFLLTAGVWLPSAGAANPASAGPAATGAPAASASPAAALERAPRTWVPAGRREEFREFCRSGAGAAIYGKIAADYAERYASWSPPAEPAPYGDPDPRVRTSEQVDAWRGVQDVCGEVTGVAEAATLLWLVTDREEYRARARDLLLFTAGWDPAGVTGIEYNDEGHFRLWRKMPAVYDQLRETLLPEERAAVLASFARRGRSSVDWIRARGVPAQQRNSVAGLPNSHPIRFMAMTGLSGLALRDDLPEAAEWAEFARAWYRERFTPWGGEDGGWAEGPAYWRGVMEHASWHDALLLLDDPEAYAGPFWRQTGYFPVYFVQPYLATAFGDLSNAGRFNLEPGVAEFLEHLARVHQDGYLQAYAGLCTDPRPRPAQAGLSRLSRTYPTAAEFLLREFAVRNRPAPAPASLSELPAVRHFQDIGWVSFHSALGRPEEDVQLSFKSSPYGSHSHSHADQNAFILNAYGRNLAINSGYREYHGSPHHKYYTRQTLSKNALLLNLRGQEVQDHTSTGRIVRVVESGRWAWATGDATVAYNTLQRGRDLVELAWRDVVFVDRRYFVVRDHVRLRDPGRVDWLLHGEEPFVPDSAGPGFSLRSGDVVLHGALWAAGDPLASQTWTGFPVDVDPKYRQEEFIGSQPHLSARVRDQFHFRAHTTIERREHLLLSVLWPQRGEPSGDLRLTADGPGRWRIERPDGGCDLLRLDDQTCSVESAPAP